MGNLRRSSTDIPMSPFASFQPLKTTAEDKDSVTVDLTSDSDTSPSDKVPAHHGSGNGNGTAAAGTPAPMRQVAPRRRNTMSSIGRSVTRRLSLDLDPTDSETALARSQRIRGMSLDSMGGSGGSGGEDTGSPLAADQDFKASPWQRTLHVAIETFVVARLAFRLGSYLGLGWRWAAKLTRLITYAALLMPGFLQMVLFYFLSNRVIRSIPYGRNPRNRLDIYVPRNHWKMENGTRPVVIYITGGAWTIGYKAWGSLLGRRLSKQGVVVCCLDYRNFPQGTAVDMLEDVNTGIAWVLKRVVHYGGDPERVYVVGQSCGAMLGTMALLTQAEQAHTKTKLVGGQPVWRPARIKGFVGLSGVYNCYDLADHFHESGLYHALFDRIMSIAGKPELKLLSPTYCVTGASYGKELPPILLMHGTADKSAPLANCQHFAEALKTAGAKVSIKEYAGETHTSPLIENPMRGGRDELTDDILAFVTDGETGPTYQLPLCPGFLINLAAFVCPF